MPKVKAKLAEYNQTIELHEDPGWFFMLTMAKSKPLIAFNIIPICCGKKWIKGASRFIGDFGKL